MKNLKKFKPFINIINSKTIKLNKIKLVLSPLKYIVV